MNLNTIPGALDPLKKGRVRFDPTINLGHILTFAGFVIGAVGMYTTLDRRITTLEVHDNIQAVETTKQELRTNSSLNEIKEEVREVRRGVERLQERKP
jgi:hypothetical protein